MSLLLADVEAFGYPSTVMPPVSWINSVPTDFNFWESAGERPILVNGVLFVASTANLKEPPASLLNNETVWQSFDHPTDSLVIGQRLVSGQKLVARISATNWSEGLYSFSIDDDGFVASAGSDATIAYYRFFMYPTRSQTGQFYAELTKISFGLFFPGSGVSFIQLGCDGHLRSFGWVESNWKEVKDFIGDQLNRCDYPLACGRYGICLEEGCSCPEPVEKNGPMYFRRINPSQSSLGCYPDNPISCESPQWQSLLELKDIDNPGLSVLNSLAYIPTDIEGCKRACLKNCSCMCRIFQFHKQIIRHQHRFHKERKDRM
ncbi:hypothetical protein SLEP1_g59263 [Rubroshorea leprosula]|uniref:Apple domain-containing protein n=1 Tax=Rubroshorea leprosula TaxID=152421 RepID=A0AAV5MVW2_9ROSI|nr:hypothetical protein SLEP1_g59263 [Rubroshorea leprosula]